jgi:hypothetical protein
MAFFGTAQSWINNMERNTPYLVRLFTEQVILLFLQFCHYQFHYLDDLDILGLSMNLPHINSPPPPSVQLCYGMQ